MKIFLVLSLCPLPVTLRPFLGKKLYVNISVLIDIASLISIFHQGPHDLLTMTYLTTKAKDKPCVVYYIFQTLVISYCVKFI